MYLKKLNLGVVRKVYLFILIFALSNPKIIAHISSGNIQMGNSYEINNMGFANIFYNDIEVVDDFAFLSLIDANKFEVWNVANSKKPTFVKEIIVIEPFELINDIEVVDDYFFVSFRGQIDIYNISDPTNPFVIKSITNQQAVGYDIFIENGFLYLLKKNFVEDYTNFMYSFIVVDIGNLNDIQIKGIYNSTLRTEPPPSFRPNNDRFLIKNDLVYLLATKSDSPSDVSFLEIIDINNKSNPHRIANYTLPSEAYSLVVENEIAFISTYDNDLQIINCTNPYLPTNITKFEKNGRIYEIQIIDDIGYIVLSERMVTLDINNLEKIEILGEYIIRNQGNTYFQFLEVQNDIAYIVCRSEHLECRMFVIDCSKPTNPRKLSPRGIHPGMKIMVGIYYTLAISGILLGPFLLPVGISFIKKKLLQKKSRNFQDGQEK